MHKKVHEKVLDLTKRQKEVAFVKKVDYSKSAKTIK